MKLAKILLVSSLVSLGAVGVQAEEYDGVLQFNSTASRADVRSGGVLAASLPNAYADGAQAGRQPVFVSQVARSTVQAGAVAAATVGNLYSDGASSGLTVVASNASERALQTALNNPRKRSAF